MKIYVVNFSSKATPPEVIFYCPLSKSHIHLPALREGDSDMLVWGDATTLRRQDGFPAAAKEASGWARLLKSLWQQYQGDPDRYEETKDRTWQT